MAFAMAVRIEQLNDRRMELVIEIVHLDREDRSSFVA